MSKLGLSQYSVFKRPIETTGADAGKIIFGKIKGGYYDAAGKWVEGKTLKTPGGAEITDGDPWILWGTYFSIDAAIDAAKKAAAKVGVDNVMITKRLDHEVKLKLI